MLAVSHSTMSVERSLHIEKVKKRLYAVAINTVPYVDLRGEDKFCRRALIYALYACGYRPSELDEVCQVNPSTRRRIIINAKARGHYGDADTPCRSLKKNKDKK